MPAILFICAANAARSPLAEAIARHLAPSLDVWSAGTAPTHVRPQVRAVLSEVGISAAGLRARSLYEVPMDEVDLVVTLGPEASLPVLPGRIARVSWSLPDPTSAPEEDALEAFRATRDELLRRLPPLLRSVAVGA